MVCIVHKKLRKLEIASSAQRSSSGQPDLWTELLPGCVEFLYTLEFLTLGALDPLRTGSSLSHTHHLVVEFKLDWSKMHRLTAGSCWLQLQPCHQTVTKFQKLCSTHPSIRLFFTVLLDFPIFAVTLLTCSSCNVFLMVPSRPDFQLLYIIYCIIYGI